MEFTCASTFNMEHLLATIYCCFPTVFKKLSTTGTATFMASKCMEKICDRCNLLISQHDLLAILTVYDLKS